MRSRYTILFIGVLIYINASYGFAFEKNTHQLGNVDNPDQCAIYISPVAHARSIAPIRLLLEASNSGLSFSIEHLDRYHSAQIVNGDTRTDYKDYGLDTLNNYLESTEWNNQFNNGFFHVTVKDGSNHYITAKFTPINLIKYAKIIDQECKLSKKSYVEKLKSGDIFQDCDLCPKMIVVPGGSFVYGKPDTSDGKFTQYTLYVTEFAVSQTEVTFDQWNYCVKKGWCDSLDESGMGDENKPAINLSWADALKYTAFLTWQTGNDYRLLSDAEWEYVSKAGKDRAYPWGNKVGENHANCKECGSIWDSIGTSPVATFKPNNFGVYDTSGNVFEWVMDCYHENPERKTVASDLLLGMNDCKKNVIRGGSWKTGRDSLRTTFRYGLAPNMASIYLGMRVMLDLNKGR